MKLLFIDAFSGISGDMTVGALLALGVPLEHLREELQRLPLAGYEIAAHERNVHGIVATKFDVHLGHDHHHDPTPHTTQGSHAHRAYRDIRALIDGSSLPAVVRQKALDIFAALAQAEAKVHGMTVDDVTFHEVGAVDSIVDIVATAIAVHWLGVEAAYVSPLPLGSGIVRSQHGPIPVPGPATVELLRGFVTRPGDGAGEMVTPTGAAIVATLASPAAVPPLQILATGYGAGQRSLADRPNLLRLCLAEPVVPAANEELLVLETNIDDLNPEIYAHVIERLLTAGARDVLLIPVHMKKNRPGILVQVLCDEKDREALAAIVLSETSAIGLRYHRVQRTVLPRETLEVNTPYGTVRVKVAHAPDGHRNLSPEYEDCRRLAQASGVPLKLIYQAAIRATPATR